MKKGTIKNILLIALCVVALGGLTSVLIRNINKPGNEPSISVPEVDKREKLAVFDFRRDDNKGQIYSSDIADFLNDSNKNDKIIFEQSVNVYYYDYIFGNDTLGLRLGSSTNLGRLEMEFNYGFTFNRAKISAVNYHRLKTNSSTIYNKQENGSSYQLNDSGIVDLPITYNTMKPDTIINTSFEFETNQKTFKLVGVSGRPCFLTLELWTE